VVEYKESFKTRMVQKMLPPNGRSASAVAEETGLPQPTLSRWLREAGTVGIMNIPAKKWTLVEKLRVLIEASRLDESRLGEFLRREGLHEALLTAWRVEVETALGDDGAKRGKRAAAAKRIKELERELRRKDRALAEAAAILVLKKKWRRSGGTGTTPRRTGTRHDPRADRRGRAVGSPAGRSLRGARRQRAHRRAVAARPRRRPARRPEHGAGEHADARRAPGGAGDRQLAAVPRSVPEPDRAAAGRRGAVPGVGAHDVPHLARRGAVAPPRTQ
jgi:transposase